MLSRRRFSRNLGLAGAGFVFNGWMLSGCLSTPDLGIPEVRASGSPGDLGMAHGAMMSNQIRSNLEFYLDWLSSGGRVSAQRLREMAAGFIPVLEEYFPEIAEEIDGIARGSGVSIDEIALLNARTDIAALVQREVELVKVPACTSLALFGRQAGKPSIALGQNWDWDPKMSESPVILRLSPSQRPSLVTLAEAGMVAKIGFNSQRLGVCLNFLSHRNDGLTGEPGVPIHCLLRVALTCSSLDEVVEKVDRSPRCASANFLLAQHGPDGPDAVDLEISPDRIETLEPEGSSLIHTNHFLADGLAEGCNFGPGPSTGTRYETATQLASKSADEEDAVGRMQRILMSRANLPYPISRDRNPDPDSSTLAAIVMDLSHNRLFVTKGPPHLNPWIEGPGVD